MMSGVLTVDTPLPHPHTKDLVSNIMAENMNLIGNSTQRTFENFEAVLGILYANTVHVTLTRHSCMRVF